MNDEDLEAEVRTLSPNKHTGGQDEETKLSCRDTLRGYKVVVLLAAFVCSFVDAGVWYSVSIYHMAWIDDFDAGSGITSWLGSVLHGVSLVSASLSSLLTKRLGFRPVIIFGGVLLTCGLVASSFATSLKMLILTYSIITPIGHGLFFASYFPVVSLYFYGRGRILANGLFTSGSGIGNCIIPYILHWSIDKFHWRGSMFIFASITFQICVCGALMREPNRSANTRRKKKMESTSKSSCGVSDIFTNLRFMLFTAHLFCTAIGLSIVYVHITAYTEKQGMSSRGMATLAISLMGLFNLLGRTITGLTSRVKRLDPFHYYIFCLSFTGLITIVVACFESYYLVIIWAALFGFFTGPYIAMLMIMTLRFVAISDLQTAFAVTNLIKAVAFFTGAPCAGWLYDITADYRYSFYLGGSMIALGCLILTIPLYQQCYESQQCKGHCSTKPQAWQVEMD